MVLSPSHPGQLSWAIACVVALALGSDLGFAAVFYGGIVLSLAVVQRRNWVPYKPWLARLKENAPAPATLVFDPIAAEENGETVAGGWEAKLAALVMGLAILALLVMAVFAAAHPASLVG